jgi:DivIVA domain-containing protein
VIVTEAPEHPFDVWRSPQTIRRATFARERKGWSTEEVREYLGRLADQIEAADAERGRLRAEVGRLRTETQRLRKDAPDKDRTSNEPDAHAVALFSQAQQVADRLIEEAVQQARDLMSTARKQQRDILQQAHHSAEAAAQKAHDMGTQSGSGYELPVPEIEYVRTFAQVAQVQLRSVLDALTEQVDRLGRLPDLEESHGDAALDRESDASTASSASSTGWRLGLRDLEAQAAAELRRS